MANEIKYVKTIARVEELNVSGYGNPRHKIYFTDGTDAISQSDASVNYDLRNEENIGVPLRITATRAGRVTYIERVSQTG